MVVELARAALGLSLAKIVSELDLMRAVFGGDADVVEGGHEGVVGGVLEVHVADHLVDGALVRLLLEEVKAPSFTDCAIYKLTLI